MEEENERRHFSEIPPAMLWEILGRLPIKTCLTCQLVCKEWYHIIVNKKFSSFRSMCNASRFALLFHDVKSGDDGLVFNLVEIDKELDVDGSQKCVVGVDRMIRVHPKIDTFNEIWYVRSHCNGVVCFISTKIDYFVCNLLTGQHVKLQNMHEIRNQSSSISSCVLGCCPTSRKFKILMLLSDMTTNIQVAKIQTLGNDEWRNVGNAPLKITADGCFLNGSSHWLDHNYIWSFHFEEEKFSQIPLPDDVIPQASKKKNMILSVCDSCLCLSWFSKGDSVEVDTWIMKKYGVKESWVKHMDKEKILINSEYELYLYDLPTHVSKRVEFGLYELSGPMLRIAPFDANFSKF
ncbi:unnamed protein product [Cuscuta campestris]|uniref:F-box domain-containing protein n=1 Tax=Cuscuta campestris TaxID=132261 RepID=A0A484MH64_9ASTE|nr:unnamed protein product [Cuscuta campestris]